MNKRFSQCRIRLVLCAFFWTFSSALNAAEVVVKPVPDLPQNFMMGADVSMLLQMEKVGARFYDTTGKAQDCLQILQDSGINWIRLRLWHTPVSKDGKAVGGGNNDLATTIVLAQRAKRLGLKFALDFHYSDFWADPEKQNKPVAWRDVHGQDLEDEVYRYTLGELKALAAAGVFPDLIQIGNEVNGGFLWPDGKTWQQTPGEKIGGADAFARLLARGIQAVRDIDPHNSTDQKVRIAIHLADGADNHLYRRVFDHLTSKALDYDIIGLSYYPYWHGALEAFQTNMVDIAQRYKKDMIVLETAYAYTLTPGATGSNIFGPNEQAKGMLPATVQGQADHVRSVIAAVAQLPDRRGLGVFYWEPQWYAIAGAGAATGEGNGWSNQAMFDANGRALPSLAVFKRVRPSSLSPSSK